ncbi:retropepsin-like aspartic protease [Aliikangiella sp. G2MR2-5]|uniref:retroviral-like aspartic protease family protein n=1 Tax=Aliikangiella sp. G2MR2-5 TaxID=2788943 RepID=UPI0018AB4F61|nr:retropepsin-like aspartic protease [Aliikangiella sp. G2MR2-5]
MRNLTCAKKFIVGVIMANLSISLLQAGSADRQHGHAQYKSDERCKSLTEKTLLTPFTRSTAGHVLVDGKFNGHITRSVVDTGGIGVGGVVSEKLMAMIQPKDSSRNRTNVQGANHSRAMKITQLRSSGIGDNLSEKLNFVVSPKAILEDEAEALIGSEYLCSFIVEFDFKKNQLVLHPKKKSIEGLTKLSVSQDKSLVWSTLENKSRVPGAIVMDMTINNLPVTGILDTGAKHSIMNWKAASLIGVEKGDPRIKVEENQSSGIHGDVQKESYRLKIDQLGIGEQKAAVTDIDLRVADMGSFSPLIGEGAAINLGVDFFEGRRLIIDYANRKVAISN